MLNVPKYVFPLLILSPFAAHGQEVEVIFIERTQTIHQTGQNTYVPIEETGWTDVDNYTFFTGGFAESGTISNFTFKQPEGQAETIPYDSDSEEFEYIQYFSTRQQLENTRPPGDYVFSGTGSTAGPFNETIFMGGYNPLGAKLVQNYDALQSINTEEDVVIELAPFDDLQGKRGVIDLQIEYWTGNESHEVWNSESITPEGEFGLDPSTRSVVIPKGTVWGSPDQSYSLVIYYSRLDTETAPVNFPEALSASVTSQEISINIQEYVETPWESPWWNMENFDGWYSGWLGWFQELNPAPAQYIYHLDIGTMYYTGASQESMWFYVYSGNAGWIWTGRELYPHMYSWDRGWIYHLKGSDWFYDLQENQWFELIP